MLLVPPLIATLFGVTHETWLVSVEGLYMKFELFSSSLLQAEMKNNAVISIKVEITFLILIVYLFIDDGLTMGYVTMGYEI